MQTDFELKHMLEPAGVRSMLHLNHFLFLSFLVERRWLTQSPAAVTVLNVRNRILIRGCFRTAVSGVAENQMLKS